MGIIIEQIDQSFVDSPKDVTILLGKDTFLKFTPGKSVYDTNQNIRNLINRSDLLVDLNTVEKLEKLSSLTLDIKEAAKESLQNIRFKKNAGMYKQQNEKLSQQLEEFFYSQIQSVKERILDKARELSLIDEESKFFLTEPVELYFCNKCSIFLAELRESLPDKCQFCGTVPDAAICSNTVHILKDEVYVYLKGLWFEDYVAKILRSNKNWKTWCHGSVMGTSGISHQIDVVAVEQNKGTVVIVECKSGKNIDGNDLASFVAKSSDIRSGFGLFVCLDKMQDKQEINYYRRASGLHYIDTLRGLKDSDIRTNLLQKYNL